MFRSRYFSRVPPLSGISAADTTYVLSPVDRGWTGANRPPGLIFAHGAGYGTDGVINAPYHNLLLHRLAKYFTVFVSDFDSTQTKGIWGCAKHTEFIADARDYLINTMGCASQVHLMGVSMGGLGVLNYAHNYPSNVLTVSSITGVIDLQSWYNFLDAAGKANIDQVYPGGYTNAVYGADFNPAVWNSTLSSSIPVKLFYSTADESPFYAPIPAWLAARPSTFAENYAGGHAEAGLPYMIEDIMSFVLNPAGG